jgi:hypothetical protein
MVERQRAPSGPSGIKLSLWESQAEPPHNETLVSEPGSALTCHCFRFVESKAWLEKPPLLAQIGPIPSCPMATDRYTLPFPGHLGRESDKLCEMDGFGRPLRAFRRVAIWAKRRSSGHEEKSVRLGLASVAQLAEQLICNQPVVGSSPSAGSSVCFIPRIANSITQRTNADQRISVTDTNGGLPEWLKGADCKSAGYAFTGSNPVAPT